MPLTIVAVNSSYSRRQKTIKIKATPTGNYPAGGDPVDLTAITDPTFQGSCFPGKLPDVVEVLNAPAGYSAELVAGTGTTLATSYKLKVSTTAGAELTAAAYPAALLADFFLIDLTGPNWGF